MSIVSWTPRSRRMSALILGMLVLLTLGSPVGADEIRITARAINPSPLVGEPLILSVTVRADVPVVFPADLMSQGLPSEC